MPQSDGILYKSHPVFEAQRVILRSQLEPPIARKPALSLWFQPFGLGINQALYTAHLIC
jgi:hypothetical protein